MTGHARSDGDGRRPGLWRIIVWGGAALLLLAPLVAMQLTNAVAWTGSDFAVLGVMLAVPLAILELTVRATVSLSYRAAVVLALAAAFLMTWANLAVGIIGDEKSGLNLLFFGVLAVGLAGALIARFKPRGMARALLAMAVAQAMIAVFALMRGEPTAPLIGAFAAVWLLSAWLFRRAAD